LLRRVKETCLGAYGHQDVPFEKLVEELQPERSLSHSPLFQVAFVLQNEPTQKLELPGLVFEYLSQEEKRAKFDLILTLTEAPEGLRAMVEFNADLFESATARRMLTSFQTLLAEVVAKPQSPVSDLCLLTETDQHQLITRWNPSPIDSDSVAPVFRSFEEQVERTPDAIAVIDGAESMSYVDLNNHANQLAHYLNKLGVRPEVPVGLHSKPSLQRVIGLLGILKAGGVCVPLDGTTDSERLETFGLPVIVTHGAPGTSLSIQPARIVCIDSLFEAADSLGGGSEENPNNTISLENLAYRITLGSSQIEVEHRALAHAISDCQISYSLSSADVVLHLAAGDQDTAMHEILWPLSFGGRLVIASANEANDRTALLRLMSNERISVVHLVPPALQTFLELNDEELDTLDSLSCVLCSGEILTASTRGDTWRRLGGKLHLLQSCPGLAAKLPLRTNEEGPIDSDSGQGSTRMYVLDQRAQLAPIGVTGEIYVGGPALARGYAADGAETASKFIPDAFSGIPGERLWRSAESGRRLHDGRLERLGSTEREVWIRGYLVDLAEVEIALLQAPGVNECAVLARESNDSGMQLIAYVVTSGFFLPERLNSFLQDKLRPHMVPSAYVPVTMIPLTEEGEIDDQELTRLPVLDSSVLFAWKEHLRSVPDVEQVAVVIQEAVEATAQLDLNELVPEQAHPTRAINARTEPASQPIAEVKRPAISHGQPLNEANLAVTLIEALQRAADGSPADSIVYCQHDGSEILQSYAGLLEEAERILGSLRRLGLKPQDKVIFQLDHRQDFVPAFWACVLGGFVPVPISIAPIYEESNSTVSKLLNSWKMLDHPLVLAGREIAAALNSLAKNLGMQDFSVSKIDDLRSGTADKNWYAAAPDDVALILLTSGSTGMPKGVVLTHRKIVGRSAATAQMNNFSSSDVSLNWFPLDHVGGLVMFHVRDVCVGARQIQVPTNTILSDPLKWLDLMEHYRVTITWAPNFAYALVNDRHADRGDRHWDLSSLRFILNGGEAVVARTARRFLDLLAPYGLLATAMHPAWGMSETCSGVTYSDRFTRESTSDDDSFVEVGSPVPGISIRIADPQDQPVAEETIGRLQVRGVSVLSEYYKNPEINQQSFTEDGWFITGDIGFLKDGRLTITGREKDVIIVNGANYYSHEIESVVEEIEGVEVSFTAACSISQPGSDTDRLAIFFHTPNSDWQRRLALINEVRQRVVRSIGVNAEFVIPVEKDEIPKTAIGKIQRSLLVERFKEGGFDLALSQIEFHSGRGKTLPDWFFKKIWRRRLTRTLPRTTAGSILILCDKEGLGRQLRIELDRLHQPSVMVEAGAEFSRFGLDSYRLDVSNPDHYRQLVQSLANDQVQLTQVLHLLTYGEYEGEATSQEQLDKAQDQGLYSLLYLVQALDQEVQDEERRIHMVVVSTHAQALSSTDKLACEKSTMFGLLKTLPLERQWLSCRHVDLPPDLPSVNAVRLIPEISNRTAADEVAYRNGQRWVSQLEKVNLLRQPLRDLPFKSGGLYLLTGGLGGIGVEIARYLLKHHEARLILVGRTSLDELAAHAQGGENEASRRLEAYEELKRLGGDVVYESVDITNLSQLQRVVSENEGRLNCELDGVIHLAGTFREQLIEQATRESVDATLSAKVYGTWTLHELLKARRKDLLFISFSSVNSYFGGVTVGAYAAANSFLETFMQYRRNQGWSNSYSYSWSLWDETGMTRGYLLKDLSRARGYFAISAEQGVKSWLAGLHRREPQLLIGLDGGNRSIKPHVAGAQCLMQKVTAYFTSHVAEPSLVQLAEASVPDRFQHQVDCEFVQLSELPLKEGGEIDLEKLSGLVAGDSRVSNDDGPRSETEIQLCRIWQELLAIQRVGRHDNFFQLGGHSLLSMQLISRLRDTFQIELPLRTLFQSSTVAELAEQIDNVLWVRQDHHEPLASIGSQYEEGIL
jgi:acyl-CoA synthetase (AMP-forming)/AMP-acid ligase II/NADP-dependent 3-hydroxy acid dehydrogenase YdfG/acyl carrier protein